jgi:hypothetical protein
MNILIGLVKSTNALLDNILQGSMLDMGMNAFREKEQEQELTNPALKSLRDAVAAMTPHPTLAARFHKPFVTNDTSLLLFKQEYKNIRVTPAHDPQLGNWVKNMKTQLRNLMQGTGHFVTDSRYVQYLTKINVTISKDSTY